MGSCQLVQPLPAGGRCGVGGAAGYSSPASPSRGAVGSSGSGSFAACPTLPSFWGWGSDPHLPASKLSFPCYTHDMFQPSRLHTPFLQMTWHDPNLPTPPPYRPLPHTWNLPFPPKIHDASYQHRLKHMVRANLLGPSASPQNTMERTTLLSPGQIQWNAPLPFQPPNKMGGTDSPQ